MWTAALILPDCARAQATPHVTTLYSFNAGGNSAFAYPNAPVTIGAKGVLYGTTSNNGGAVYSLAPPASPGSPWTASLLHEFAGGGDGYHPGAGVVIGSGGILYGTTVSGGTAVCSCGTVFSLTPPASSGGAWTESVIYSFTGGGDGAAPLAGVVIGKNGVLYGTTSSGGEFLYYGTVYSLTPPSSPGGSWTETTLYSFSGFPDAGDPYASVAIGSGALYGTTFSGGTANAGTVFSLTPPGSPGAAWTENVLYSFTDNTGAFPSGSVAPGSGGVLYGTVQLGGNRACLAGCGAVFSLAPGGAWTETVLYNLRAASGGNPYAGVTIGNGGVLYGTAFDGGTGTCTGGCGVLFSLTPPVSPGSGWTETVLHRFQGADGANPAAGVTISKSGVIYGTTSIDGTMGGGTVFEFK